MASTTTQRISAPGSALYRRGTPPLLAAIFVIVCVLEWNTWQHSAPHPSLAPLLIAPVVIAIVGVWTWFAILRTLIDEVRMDAAGLDLRRGHVYAHIAWAGINAVTVRAASKPARLALECNRDTPFGRSIVFVPEGASLLIASAPPQTLIDELQRHIDAARGNAATGTQERTCA